MDPATKAIKTKQKVNKTKKERKEDVSITDNIFPPLFKTGHKRKSIEMFPYLLVFLKSCSISFLYLLYHLFH